MGLTNRDPTMDEARVGGQARRFRGVEAVEPVLVRGREVLQQVEPDGGGALRRSVQDVDIDPDPHSGEAPLHELAMRLRAPAIRKWLECDAASAPGAPR